MPNVRVMSWNIKDFKGSTFAKHGNVILSKLYDAANVRQVDVFVIVEPFSKITAFGVGALVTQGAGLDGVLALYFALKSKDASWRVVPLRTTAAPPKSDMIALFYHSGVVDFLGPEELGGVGALVTTTANPAGHPLPWDAATNRWGQVRHYAEDGTEVNFYGRRPSLFYVGAPDRVTRALSVTTIAEAAPPAPLALITNLLPAGAEGAPYEVLFQADGGTLPHVWAQTLPTNLPAGIVFNAATATLQGTPTVSGPFSFSVAVTDATGATANATFPLSIAAANAALTLETTALPQGLQNKPYRARLVSQGGRSPRRAVAGALPPGLVLARDGLLSGTPTAASVHHFNVDVVSEASTAQDFTMDVVAGGAPLTVFTNALPDGVVGTPYEFLVQADGGTAPYAWALGAATALVAGLHFDVVTGILGGTPTAAGLCTLDVSVSDATPTTVNSLLTFNVAAPRDTLGFVTAAALPRALANSPYRTRLATTGGNGDRVAVLAGQLPQGLALKSGEAARTFTLSVEMAAGAGLAVFTNALPNGVVGAAYQFLLQGAGGTAPYTWTQNGGTALVAGLIFTAATGIISGTPTAAGACVLDVTLTDSVAASVTAVLNFTVVVTAAELQWVTSVALPRALFNQPYSVRLASTGGYGPHEVETTGALPAGLSVDREGLVSGSPTTAALNQGIPTRVTDGSALISGTPTTPVVGHAATVQLFDSARSFKLVALHAPPQARHPQNRDCVRALAKIREITSLRGGVPVAICGDFNCCTHPLQNCGTHKAGEMAALGPLIAKGYVSQNNNERTGCKTAERASKDVYAVMNGTASDATLDALCTHSFDHVLTLGFTAVTNVDTVNLVREDPAYAAAKTQANVHSVPHPIKGIIRKYLWKTGVSDHLPVRFTLGV